MARDEEAHCQQLSLAARLPTYEAFDGISKKSLEPGPLYEQAEMILGKVRNNKLSILEMLKTAVVLEKEFRKIHATYALEFKTTALRSTFDNLARADTEHLRALDTYLKKYKAEHSSLLKNNGPITQTKTKSF